MLCYSDGTSTEENIAKIMKFAWLVPPCGVIITTAASGFVFWWKGLSFSDPYGQGILITGTLKSAFALLLKTSCMYLDILANLMFMTMTYVWLQVHP